jgi:hypothetical protein
MKCFPFPHNSKFKTRLNPNRSIADRELYI